MKLSISAKRLFSAIVYISQYLKTHDDYHMNMEGKMSRVSNREKERAKDYVILNIASNITNVTAALNEVQELIANINYLIGGLPSATDTHWTSYCQRILGNLSQASVVLRQGLESAKQLDILEWNNGG